MPAESMPREYERHRHEDTAVVPASLYDIRLCITMVTATVQGGIKTTGH